MNSIEKRFPESNCGNHNCQDEHTEICEPLHSYLDTAQKTGVPSFTSLCTTPEIARASERSRVNVLGIIARHPELARDGIELRKFGLMVIESLAQERVHPSWIVPGGVATALTPQLRDKILADIPTAKAIADRTIHFFKAVLDDYKDEIANF